MQTKMNSQEELQTNDTVDFEQNKILQIRHFTALKILQSSKIKRILFFSRMIEKVRDFTNTLYSMFDKNNVNIAVMLVSTPIVFTLLIWFKFMNSEESISPILYVVYAVLATLIGGFSPVIIYIIGIFIDFFVKKPMLFILKFMLLCYFHVGLKKEDQLAMYDALNSFGLKITPENNPAQRLYAESEEFWTCLNKKNGSEAFNLFVDALASAKRINDLNEQNLLDSERLKNEERNKENIEQSFDKINPLDAAESLFKKL